MIEFFVKNCSVGEVIRLSKNTHEISNLDTKKRIQFENDQTLLNGTVEFNDININTPCLGIRHFIALRF